MLAKYNLSQADLDVLLYIYSESYFTRKTFFIINKVLKWEDDKLSRMMKDGWIEKFRNSSPGKPARYQISIKGSRLVTDLYNILDGDREISQKARFNPLYSSKQDIDKNYIKMLEEMIEDTKRLKALATQQQLRPPHE